MPNPPKRWFLELDPMGSQYLIISGYATLWKIGNGSTLQTLTQGGKTTKNRALFVKTGGFLEISGLGLGVSLNSPPV